MNSSNELSECLDHWSKNEYPQKCVLEKSNFLFYAKDFFPDPIAILDHIHAKGLSCIGKRIMAILFNAFKNVKIVFNIKHCSIEKLNLNLDKTLKDKIIEFKGVLKFDNNHKIDEVFLEKTYLETIEPNKKHNFTRNKNEIFKAYDKIVKIYDFLNIETQMDFKEPQPLNYEKPSNLELRENMKSVSNIVVSTFDEIEEINSEEFEKNINVTLTYNPERLLKTDNVQKEIKKEFCKLDRMRRSFGYSQSKLSNLCKDLLRLVNKHYKTKEYLASRDMKDKLISEFLTEFTTFLKTTKIKFQVDIIEDYTKNLYVEYSKDRLLNYSNIYRYLLKTKENITHKKKNHLDETEKRLKKMKLQISTNDELAEDNLKRINFNKDSSKTNTKFILLKTAGNTRLERQLHILKSEQQEYWKKELLIRRKRNGLKSRLENIKERCYEYEAIYAKEIKRSLEESTHQEYKILEEKYYPLEKKFLEIMQRRENKFRKLQDEKRSTERSLLAASKIQNWWRSYKIKGLKKHRNTHQKRLNN